MTHDPLCPVVQGCVCGEPDDYLCCQCDLIREVRADTLNKARSLVTALACPITVAERRCKECEQYREVLAVIDTLRGDS